MKKEENLNYDPVLYRVCTKVVTNIDQYEGTPIYEKMIRLEDNPIFIPKEERTNFSVYARALHNQTKVLFEVLQGKGEIKDDDNMPKGYNVRPLMDISNLSDESIITAINVLGMADFSKDKYKGQKSNEKLYVKERSQIRRYLYRIDVERSDEILNYVIDCMYMRAKNMNEEVLSKESIAELGISMENTYEKCRRFLLGIKQKNNIHELYKKILLEDLNSLLLEEIEKECPQFFYLRKYYHTWLYVDLSCHHIMQYLNNAIDNQFVDFFELVHCLDKTVNKLIQKELEKKSRKSTRGVENEHKMDAYEYLFTLFSFYKFRDRLLENIKAIKIIKKICTGRKNPEEKYSLLEPADDMKKPTQNEIRELFAEEVSVDRVTFITHFEKIKKLIPLYNEVSGRHIKYNSISAKAIYREIYLDDTLYEGKTCKTIFNELLNTGILGKSEYYFVNEKINLGIWREYGCLNEYYRKNEFQENLYYLIILVLANIDSDIICKKMENIVKCLEKEIDRYLCRKFTDY